MNVIAHGPKITSLGITYEAKFFDCGDTGCDLRYIVYIESCFPLDNPKRWRSMDFYYDDFIGAFRYFSELVAFTIDVYERKRSI
jgi:hypothetical protein